MLWSLNNIMILIVCVVGVYTTVLFYIAFFDNDKKIKDPKPQKNLPTVTICVPAFNERHATIKTIESLVNLDYPGDKLNIIVVDDGSTDDTHKLVKDYLLKANYSNVKLYSKKNGGKYTALNLALKKSKTEFFGVLDADSVVDKHALLNMIGYFKDNNVVAVTPSMKIWPKGNIIQRIQAIEYFLGIFLRKVFSYMNTIHVTPGPFSIFRRSFFDKYGYYREAYMTEDIELALRIQTHHFKIENSLNAHVYTAGPKTLKVLNKQRLRWYAGFIKNTIDYKHLFNWKYGNLGFFFLPLAYFSVFLVFISLIYQIIRLLMNSYNHIRVAILSNFDIFRWSFNFDKFYVGVGPVALITALSFLLGLIVIYHSYFLSKKQEKSVILSLILFFIFYYFLYAYWWFKSLHAVIQKKELSWHHKSEVKSEVS